MAIADNASPSQPRMLRRPAPLTRFYSVTEIAALLNVSRRSVDRWVTQGLLPQKASMPGHPRWHKDDIDRWIASR